jgi:hypothetical protein
MDVVGFGVGLRVVGVDVWQSDCWYDVFEH